MSTNGHDYTSSTSHTPAYSIDHTRHPSPNSRTNTTLQSSLLVRPHANNNSDGSKESTPLHSPKDSYGSVQSPLVNGHSKNATTDTSLQKQSNGTSSSAADTADDSSAEELLSTWELILLCIPVVPSQLGWALGESVLVPYLISLGVQEELANVIW